MGFPLHHFCKELVKLYSWHRCNPMNRVLVGLYRKIWELLGLWAVTQMWVTRHALYYWALHIHLLLWLRKWQKQYVRIQDGGYPKITHELVYIEYMYHTFSLLYALWVGVQLLYIHRFDTITAVFPKQNSLFYLGLEIFKGAWHDPQHHPPNFFSNLL